jgi:hypothetical protein
LFSPSSEEPSRRWLEPNPPAFYVNGYFVLTILGRFLANAEIHQSTKAQLGGVPAAIPESQSYAMLLAELGLLGFMARRRATSM